MKKGSLEYQFGLSPRGRVAGDARNATANSTPLGAAVALWAPLDGFQWKGRRYKLADDTWIRPRREYSGYLRPEFRSFLSKEERQRCASTRHWLHIKRHVHDPLSSRVMVNAALTALWIARPTRTHGPLRFEEAESGIRSVIRVLDRFQWVEGHVADELAESDLAETARIFPRVRDCLIAQKRVGQALGLTFRGCVTNGWRSAVVLYASAVETLLTDGDECSLDRLSWHYAAVVTDSSNDAQIEAKRFRSLFAIRSDIIHGRLSGAGDADLVLENFAAFGELLRRLWRTILASKKLIAALELSDAERSSFFSRLREDVRPTHEDLRS